MITIRLTGDLEGTRHVEKAPNIDDALDVNGQSYWVVSTRTETVVEVRRKDEGSGP